MDKQLLKGTSKLLILAALARRPMHGYALSEYLKQTVPDSLAFGAGMLYPMLHKLEKDKLIVGEWHELANMRRKIYSLTKRGKKELAQKTTEWREMSLMVKKLVNNFAI